jgi:hypothetical protein
MGAAASIKAAIGRKLTVYRENRELVKINEYDRKFHKLQHMLIERRSHNFNQVKETIPELKKRTRKARKKLMKTLPSSEISLSEARESYQYLHGLRERLVQAGEKSTSQPYGCNPSDEILEGVQALADGNSYTREWQELNANLQVLITKHKKEEMDWIRKHVKKCTEWMKRLQSLIKKLDACIDIGKEVVGILDNIIEPLLVMEKKGMEHIHKLDSELKKAERTINRLHSEKLRIETAAAFADKLIFKGHTNSHLIPTKDMSQAKKKWLEVIGKVIELNNEVKRKKHEKMLLQIEYGDNCCELVHHIDTQEAEEKKKELLEVGEGMKHDNSLISTPLGNELVLAIDDEIYEESSDLMMSEIEEED